MNGVINGACRACEMEYIVHLAHIERCTDIELDKFKAGVAAQMLQVGAAAGEQVVYDHHTPAIAEQGVAQMGSQEASATGHQRPLVALVLLVPFCNSAAGTPSG